MAYRPQTRLTVSQGGPLRSGDRHQFGFYDAGVLRSVIDNIGGSYHVHTMPVPSDLKEYQAVVELVNKPEVQYALVDKDKLVFVTLTNGQGWLSELNKLGYEVKAGAKTAKRLKAAHRPTLLNYEFKELDIVYVDNDFYTYHNFEDESIEEELKDPKLRKILLDGCFVISNRLVRQAVSNLPVNDFENEAIKDTREYYFDPRIRREIVNDLLNSKVFNARIIMPEGFLKGNCFAIDLPEGIDVIASKANLKDEFSYSNGYKFQAEPQGPKSKVILDIQTFSNFPKLCRKTDVEMWMTEEYKKLYQEAISGKLLTNWKYLYTRMWRDINTLEENEANIQMAYVGYRWVAAGFKVTDSPWLFETTAVAHALPYKKRVPIPCSVYEQVVSESMAAMAGYMYQIPRGSILRCNDLGVHVVNDLDWIEMYPSHGGHDGDDFFKIFYREMKGNQYNGKKVIVIRSPNGYGEYSIFDYIEGEWSPSWYKSDGTQVKFPEVNGTNWPQRLSDAIREGKVSYDGLPSESLPSRTYTGTYSKEHFLADVEIAMAGGNVGGYVNACMFHALHIGKHRPKQLCSLETAIDKCIGPDDQSDVQAIDKEAKKIFQEVLASGKPIDVDFWLAKGSPRLIKPGQDIDFIEGRYTKFNDILSTKHDAYVAKIRDWAQQNAKPQDLVYQLGKRLSSHGVNLLREFRKAVYVYNSQNEGSDTISTEWWNKLYSSLADKLSSMERESDQHDYVLALYHACLTIPTSYGKISDQAVMNTDVYPLLESALQYYGIARSCSFVEDQKTGLVSLRTYRNKEWWYMNSERDLVKYTDPLSFQAAHAADSTVTTSMRKVERVDTPII